LLHTSNKSANFIRQKEFCELPHIFEGRSYYSDLYDRQTVEECRNMEKRFAEAAVGTSAEQAWQTLLVKVALYFLRGAC